MVHSGQVFVSVTGPLRFFEVLRVGRVKARVQENPVYCYVGGLIDRSFYDGRPPPIWMRKRGTNYISYNHDFYRSWEGRADPRYPWTYLDWCLYVVILIFILFGAVWMIWYY